MSNCIKCRKQLKEIENDVITYLYPKAHFIIDKKASFVNLEDVEKTISKIFDKYGITKKDLRDFAEKDGNGNE